jgi:hypothetical protein
MITQSPIERLSSHVAGSYQARRPPILLAPVQSMSHGI